MLSYVNFFASVYPSIHMRVPLSYHPIYARHRPHRQFLAYFLVVFLDGWIILYTYGNMYAYVGQYL